MIRKSKPRSNNMGGLTKVYIYKVSQFTLDVLWPVKSDIVNGILTAFPILNAQQAALIVFDVKENKASSTGSTTLANYNYLHGIKGKVAGYTTEKHTEVSRFEGEDLILVARRPNGDRLVLGQTYMPMRMIVSDDFGAGAEGYVGSDIEFYQVDAVDFRPPILQEFVGISHEGVLPYD